MSQDTIIATVVAIILAILVLFWIRASWKQMGEDYKKQMAENTVPINAPVNRAPSNTEVMLVGIFGAVIAFAGLALVAMQIYWYLQSGTWTPLSLIDVGKYIYADRQYSNGQSWLFYPTTWIGLHSILNMTPTSAVLLVVGYLFAVNNGN